MKHSQKVFKKSCLGRRAVALKSGKAGLLLAVILTCFAAVQTARAGLTFQLLYEFNGTNGLNPTSGLVQGNDGNFYGSTYRGGAGYIDYSEANGGKGTVFRTTPNGVLTTLISFDGWNGNKPIRALVQCSDGNFYGTTQRGGVGGQGTVFQITTNGTLTTLYSFSSLDGAWPSGGVLQGNDGNFYGTTGFGGASGYGTVFQLTSGGTLTTLHSFSNTDGQYADAALVQGNDGNLYSTTYLGGAYDHGTVFKITTSGVLTTLFSFNGITGGNTSDGLVQGSDGDLYGTTGFGASNNGAVFKITTNGTLTSLFSFNGTNGDQPQASLIQASDGNFYGTTASGGAYGLGTIFRLVQSPRPLITAITQSSGIVTLTWTSFTNEIYRVEYKPSLAATNWTALTPNVTATNSTASKTDNPGGATERYYQVVLLP